MLNNASNKKQFRIIAGDTEIIINATPAKAQQLMDVLLKCGSSSICPGTFTPSKSEFLSFSNRAPYVLYP